MIGRPRVGRDTAVMRIGIAHHLGWAVAVTAATDHRVVDRRRIELIAVWLVTPNRLASSVTVSGRPARARPMTIRRSPGASDRSRSVKWRSS